MKRLIELPQTDRLTVRANALVRALGPTIESEERLRRVRRSLDAPPRVVAPRWAWRAALAFGLLGGAATAAGMVGVSGTFGASPAAPSAALQVAPPVRVGPASSRAGEGASVAPLGEPSPATPSAPPAAPNATLGSRSSAAHAAAAPFSDVARVHEAAKALRHDADPQRALQLLERPGSRITGPLAEEALALRIEASAARGDGRTAKLAAAYLEQYPNGRYRELAKKVLGGRQR
jgi:hypothetical protein